MSYVDTQCTEALVSPNGGLEDIDLETATYWTLCSSVEYSADDHDVHLVESVGRLVCLL